MAAGPVSRILSALRRDGHSSGPRITAGLKRPTRRLWRTGPARAPGQSRSFGQEIPPYLVLLRVGFALPATLLRRRCALTAPFHPYRNLAARRYVFCGTFRRTIPPMKARAPSRTLSGTLPCGVRTFLCLATATARPSCQQDHYIRSAPSKDASLGSQVSGSRLRPCC